MNGAVLIIDDDANLLSAMKRQLRGRFTVVTAQGGEEGLTLIDVAAEQPAVILCDMRMGGIDGVETLRRARAIAPDSVRMMLTGNADMQTAIDAINDGNIFRFLTKPCPPDALEAGLTAAMEQHRLLVAERELLEKTLAGSVKVLTDMLAMASPEGFGRANRIRAWVRQITAAFAMPQRWQLELAAMLAPLGLLSIPDEVVAKLAARQPLSDVERTMIERSPEAARNVIANIPRLDAVAQIVYLQNRGYDGSGFPADGPRGGDIPLDARIIKILNDLGDICGGPEPSRSDFMRLESHAERYDPIIFKKIRAALEVTDAVAQRPLDMRQISADLLLPGMVLAADVVTTDGRLVLASMVTISEAHVERLHNLVRLKRIGDTVSVLTDVLLR
jgi:response regulator RpfG family c-di-GMP phosphodiesterase